MSTSLTHGGHMMPPQRECTCGHTYSLHRGNKCRLAAGCPCLEFVSIEALQPVPDATWMPAHKRPRQNGRPAA